MIMTIPLYAFTMLLVSGAGTISAQQQSTGLACIKEMLLPGYGSIARKAKQTGSVTANVTIGQIGDISDLKTTSPDPFLAQEVEVFLRYNTRFRQDCSGKTVQVIFTFALEGHPVPDPTVRVTFKGPNEFVIRSQPQAPITDRMPPNPKGEDKFREGE